MSTVVKDLGPVTAYADAVAAGYTGTKEEWQALMASYASVAEEAQEAKEGAEAAQEAAESARDAAIDAKEGAEDAVDGFGAVVTQATNQAVQTVRAEGTTQVGNVSSEGTTQVNAVQAKGAEVIQSIPADYTELSNDVVQLKEDLSDSIDVMTTNGKKYIPKNITWVNGYVGKDDGKIRSSSLSKTGIFPLGAGETVTVGTQNKNICVIGTTESDTIAVGDTVTVLVISSAVDQYEVHSYTAQADMNIVVSVLASNYEVVVTEDTNLSALFGNVNEIDVIIDDMIDLSVNLADPSKFTRNAYMTAEGATGSNTSYFYTDKIPVAEGDVLYYNLSDKRYVTAFNGDAVISISNTGSPLTIPSGVTYIVFTGYMSRIDSFYVVKNINLPFVRYGETIDNDYLRIGNKNTINGNDGITITSETINADTTLSIDSYPKILAQHDRISGYCEFSTLGEILFGYGYGTNSYCGVDATNINVYVAGTLSTSVPHGVTISDYLSFAIIMNDNREGVVTINSTGGTATTTISLGYNKNGLPFVRSTTALTNVKLSAICKDIKNPIWWFGDSYSSLAPERIIGQLNNYGVIGNMLIDAVPGGRSYHNADTGAYIEFLKLTKLAIPKYVVWSLGMNDTEVNYKYYLQIVKNYCDVLGITLYAVKIPSVPNIDNSGKNAFIEELGIPAIDWAKAVGATAQGVWYTGYLSSDNVHPTANGARAMAARTIVDCPAIMQF